MDARAIDQTSIPFVGRRAMNATLPSIAELEQLNHKERANGN